MVERLDGDGQEVGEAGERNVDSGGAPALRFALPRRQELDEDEFFENLPGAVLTLTDRTGTFFHREPVGVVREERDNVRPIPWKRGDGDAAQQL